MLQDCGSPPQPPAVARVEPNPYLSGNTAGGPPVEMVTRTVMVEVPFTQYLNDMSLVGVPIRCPKGRFQVRVGCNLCVRATWSLPGCLPRSLLTPTLLSLTNPNPGFHISITPTLANPKSS